MRIMRETKIDMNKEFALILLEEIFLNKFENIHVVIVRELSLLTWLEMVAGSYKVQGKIQVHLDVFSSLDFLSLFSQ